jgi:hypothetical protein
VQLMQMQVSREKTTVEKPIKQQQYDDDVPSI